MALYNLTGINTNTTGVLSFVRGVNENLMQGWLGTLFLIGLLIVIFMTFITTTGSVRKSFAATGFIGFISALFLRAVTLIPDKALIIILVIMSFSIAFSWRGDGE